MIQMSELDQYTQLEFAIHEEFNFARFSIDNLLPDNIFDNAVEQSEAKLKSWMNALTKEFGKSEMDKRAEIMKKSIDDYLAVNVNPNGVRIRFSNKMALSKIFFEFLDKLEFTNVTKGLVLIAAAFVCTHIFIGLCSAAFGAKIGVTIALIISGPIVEGTIKYIARKANIVSPDSSNSLAFSAALSIADAIPYIMSGNMVIGFVKMVIYKALGFVFGNFVASPEKLGKFSNEKMSDSFYAIMSSILQILWNSGAAIIMSPVILVAGI